MGSLLYSELYISLGAKQDKQRGAAQGHSPKYDNSLHLDGTAHNTWHHSGKYPTIAYRDASLRLAGRPPLPRHTSPGNCKQHY